MLSASYFLIASFSALAQYRLSPQGEATELYIDGSRNFAKINTFVKRHG